MSPVGNTRSARCSAAPILLDILPVELRCSLLFRQFSNNLLVGPSGRDGRQARPCASLLDIVRTVRRKNNADEVAQLKAKPSTHAPFTLPREVVPLMHRIYERQ